MSLLKFLIFELELIFLNLLQFDSIPIPIPIPIPKLNLKYFDF